MNARLGENLRRYKTRPRALGMSDPVAVAWISRHCFRCQSIVFSIVVVLFVVVLVIVVLVVVVLIVVVVLVVIFLVVFY